MGKKCLLLRGRIVFSNLLGARCSKIRRNVSGNLHFCEGNLLIQKIGELPCNPDWLKLCKMMWWTYMCEGIHQIFESWPAGRILLCLSDLESRFLAFIFEVVQKEVGMPCGKKIAKSALFLWCFVCFRDLLYDCCTDFHGAAWHVG